MALALVTDPLADSISIAGARTRRVAGQRRPIWEKNNWNEIFGLFPVRLRVFEP